MMVKNKRHILFYLTCLLGMCLYPISGNASENEKKYRENIKSAGHDSVKVNLYLEWMKEIGYSDAKLTRELNDEIIKISKNNLGKKKTKKEELLFFNLKLAKGYNTLGVLNSLEGKYAESLKYYQKTLSIYQKVNSERGIAATLANIGIIYEMQEKYDIAEEYYTKSLAIYKKINHEFGLSDSYNNLGNLNYFRGDKEKALDYYKKALRIKYKLNDQKGISQNLNNVGVIYMDIEKFDSALFYYKKSLEIKVQAKDEAGLAASYSNIGTILNRMKNYDEARIYQYKSLQIAKKLHHIEQIKTVYYSLSLTDSADRKYDEALKNYKLFILYRDSMINIESREKLVEQEMQFKFDKEKSEDSIVNAKQKQIDEAEIRKQKAEIKAKKIQQYYLFGGLVMIAFFSLFIFSRYRITKKQKRIIEIQKREAEMQKEEISIAKHLVDEKNKEITDSINYARRLQEAILPSEKVWSSRIADSFILYLPKDIVAGDFYFMEIKDNYIFAAAADCTGHGVPGAMVSVVCSNALTRSVKEYGLTETGKILDKTRELVIETFEKSENKVKDGMDISLIRINPLKNELQWSGANNPLWIFRNKECLVYKADKQPIGFNYEMLPFTSHTVQILKNDCIYFFTDGYADQFGGPKKKKFKEASLKSLLAEICHLPMDKQKIMLHEKLSEWKGDLEQVDDVCIIGVRI